MSRRLHLGVMAIIALAISSEAEAQDATKWFTCWANVHSAGPPFSDENLMLRLVTVIPQGSALAESEVSAAWADFVLEQPSSGTPRPFCRGFDASKEAGDWRDSLLLGQSEDPRLRPVAWRLAGASSGFEAPSGPVAAATAVAPSAAGGEAAAPEAGEPSSSASTPAEPVAPAAAAPVRAETSAETEAALARTRDLNQSITDRHAAIAAENRRLQERYERQLAEQQERNDRARKAHEEELARARAAEEDYRRRLKAYQEELASGKYSAPQ